MNFPVGAKRESRLNAPDISHPLTVRPALEHPPLSRGAAHLDLSALCVGVMLLRCAAVMIAFVVFRGGQVRAKGFGKALQETGKEAKGAKSASELKEVRLCVGFGRAVCPVPVGGLLYLLLGLGVLNESVNPCK